MTEAISVTACNFCFLSRDQEQQLDRQKHCLCDKADWPPSVLLSPPQIWLRPLTRQQILFLLCKMLVGLPGSGRLWNEDYCLHLLRGCSSATIKCRHVMKGKAAGHLQPLISIQHVFTTLLHPSLHQPSSLRHCLSLCLSVLLTYSSAQVQLSSSYPYRTIPHFIFTKYFSLALALIMPFRTSLHVTLLLFPYLTSLPSWLQQCTGGFDPIPGTAYNPPKSFVSRGESAARWCKLPCLYKQAYILPSPWRIKIAKCMWEYNCHSCHLTVGYKAC